MSLWVRATERLTLEPIFGPKTFGADTTCEDIHCGPIPDGDRVCCMVCFGTGVPDHPDLKETAAGRLRLKNWEPEGGKDPWGHATKTTVYDGGSKPSGGPKTRRERRAEAWSPKVVYMDPRRIERLVDEGRAEPMGPS